MADKRRIAATGRIVTGVVGIVVFVGVAVAVGQNDLPVLAADAPTLTVTPTASDQSRLCPGPLLRQGVDATAGSFATPALTVSANSATEQAPLVTPDNTSGDQFGLPTTVSAASADGEDSPLIAAAQSQYVASDDLTGFAATACGEVSADSWLVGGSTDVGRTTLLSLSNPTRTDAVVDLSFFGETGEIDAPGAKGIVVPAGENRLHSLASFAPGVRTPVIRVQSAGGQVFSALQHSVTRGITPGGIELSAPTTPPSTDQVIPGVVLAASAPVASGDVYDDSVGALRLFVPGTEAANVALSFVSEQGAEAPVPVDHSILPGVVNEITLPDLPAGSYTVSIASDLPLVAAARTTAVVGESSDFAWFGSSAPLDERSQLAVAPGDGARVHLFNPTSSPLEVVLTDGSGVETRVAVPAGGAVAPRVAGGMAYGVTGAGGAHAQVSFEGPRGFSAYAVQPPKPLATPVTVYPR
ncbi:DUF5719 family protein [Mycetocola sp. 2940]|uniref:DUF5719 family protein n=1 Tax=Mycetocola sp. 2940 TaxID=3156452 RepID=UPI003393C4ED